MPLKLALIGDIHSFWTDFDTDYFNQSDYDILLFTGDLPKLVGGVPDAKKLSKLTKPGIVIPGNHDACTIPQFLAELKNWQSLCKLTSIGQASRVKRLQKALGPLQLGGYSIHPLNDDTACIVARPHSMGGDRMYFTSYLKSQFGVASINDSTNKLCRLIDEAPKNLIFLAHNGPAGLGQKPTDIYGCDFNPALGDFGDEDLKQAVNYAKNQKKNVKAVVAGHMHHHLKGANEEHKKGRYWNQVKDDVLYINAARVPRIFKTDKNNINSPVVHHHICLTIGENTIFEEMLLMRED